MIDNVGNKIKNLLPQEYSLKIRSFWKISYLIRNVYETKTVTSGLCYIEDLISFQNNIV